MEVFPSGMSAAAAGIPTGMQQQENTKPSAQKVSGLVF